ncbi:MAG: hypothetical protein M1358_00500 [Chloroflexi bacterium]|nr:hypothetical protein [Chloroflexota bacterium]
MHAWFDREISTSTAFPDGNQLDRNVWLYEMNRNIMPVAATGPGVDLGDFTPRTRRWAAYAKAPSGRTYIEAHNRDLDQARSGAGQYFNDPLTVNQWPTYMALVFAGLAYAYEGTHAYEVLR